MNILIFTSEFPYGEDSEIFLANELNVIAKQSTITILPLTKSKKCRSLPDNVFVNNACNNQPKLFYGSIILKMLFSLFFWKAVFSKKLVSAKKANQKYFYFKNLLGAFIIKTVIKQHKVDYQSDTIFYSYWLTYAPLGLAMLKKESYLKNKIVSRAHSYEIDEEEVGFYFPLRNLTYQYIDFIFPISQKGANTIRNRYGESHNKIYVQRLGVLPIRKDASILSKDLIHIVSCSGVRPEKRVDMIFKSLNEYCKVHPNINIEWTHIGASMGYDVLKKTILIKENNLTVNLLGALESYEVYNFYKSKNLNIFINLSTREGVPVAIMEAISASIPVLATDVGATSEAVTSETGVLISKDFTQSEFNDGIDFIIENYTRLASTIFNYYQRYYSAEDNYCKFYKSLKDIVK